MRFGICTLDDWDVSGRTVLCRVDINQPVDRTTGTLRSTKRIEACVPTVRELADRGAKVVLLAHQGSDIEYQNFWSTEPHAQVLRGLLEREVRWIDDVCGPAARTAIQALGDAGVRKTVMLTGDIGTVADQVAAELGVDQVYSQLLPADKVEKVEALLREKPGKAKLAFVGDGINDAPVLSRADIGIAMGAMGSDAAIEAADVVLMDDDPLKIAKAIRISRKCLGIVYQNIVFAIGIKLACLILVALGLANMWLAIFADVGVMILAVLNAIRALFVKNL